MPASFKILTAIAFASLLGACATPTEQTSSTGRRLSEPSVVVGTDAESRRFCEFAFTVRARGDVHSCRFLENTALTERRKLCEKNRSEWWLPGMKRVDVDQARQRCVRAGRDFEQDFLSFQQFHEFRSANRTPEWVAFIAKYESGPDALALVPEARNRLAQGCVAPSAGVSAVELRRWAADFRRSKAPTCMQEVERAVARAELLELEALSVKRAGVDELRAFVDQLREQSDGALRARATVLLRSATLQEQQERFAACVSPTGCEGFVARYAENDPAGLVPSARAKLEQWRLVELAKEREQALSNLDSVADAQAWLDRFGAEATAAQLRQVMGRKQELRLRAYRADFAAIKTAEQAEAFAQQYLADDPELLGTKARKLAERLALSEQREALGAIASKADAEAHIARYSGRDVAGTVAEARKRIAAFERAELDARRAAERALADRVRKARVLEGRTVTWRDTLQVETSDCVGIWLIKACMKVGYEFSLTGRVRAVEADGQQLAIDIQDVQLKVPKFVSAKYLELRGRAISQAKERWLGGTAHRPVGDFL